MKIKDNLCNDVNSQIKTWQKDNYHHTLMQIKERKDMEDLFKKAQKPWAKLLAKVEKAKADYHSACKTERSATNQERNANADSSLSPDQVRTILYRHLNSCMAFINLYLCIHFTGEEDARSRAEDQRSGAKVPREIRAGHWRNNQIQFRLY